MGEIKINVSEDMNEIIQKVSDDIGIKKTEFVKSLVIQELKKIKMDEVKNEAK